MRRGAAIALASVLLFAAANMGEPATVEGCIRDEQGKPVARAEIHLKVEGADTKPETVRADDDGCYSIVSLHSGRYTLQVETASFGPFAVRESEQKKMDLVIKPSTAQIDFFDQPKYTVAEVTQNAYTGGHGSDAVKRSSEALSAATSELGKQPTPSASADLSRLREAVRERPGDPSIHHALAGAFETSGDPLAAVREYQRAAELDASEANLFDWASELLKHEGWAAAANAYESGVRKYPSSLRLLLGCAVAHYAYGDYAAARERLFEATDLKTLDAIPYLFLAKTEPREITDAPGYRERLKRFATLHPENASANYYYAACLWRSHGDKQDRAQVVTLLEKALQIDPGLCKAHLLLGDVYLEEKNLPKAQAAYEKAIETDPSAAQAHYQLGRVYRQLGDEEKAQVEFAAFQKLTIASAQQVAQQRSELQRFVLTMGDQPHNQ